jgi:uncharacterized membrane protein YhaH (DUF805 family)
MNWYIAAFKNYAVFRGRSRRKEYWMFYLFSIVFTIAAMILDNVLGIAFPNNVCGPICCIYALATLLPGFSLSVRRLHDVGSSGWYIFIALIPIAGPLLFLIKACADGTPGENQYGPNPKEAICLKRYTKENIKTSKKTIKFAVTIAFIILGGFFWIAVFAFEAIPAFLGYVKDSKRSARIVLEIDSLNLPGLVPSEMLLNDISLILKKRFKEMGVYKLDIQKQGKDRVIIDLRGFRDGTILPDVLCSVGRLEFNLLCSPEVLVSAINIIDDKINVNEGTSFKELLTGLGDQIAAQIDNVRQVNDILARKDVREALERAGLDSNKFLWSYDTFYALGGPCRLLYYVKGTPEISGNVVQKATGQINRFGMLAGKAMVDLELNPEGTRQFFSVTAANVDKYLAIVLDSMVYSAPRILQKISGGRVEITGDCSLAEAKNLAVVLRTGMLPAPLKIINTEKSDTGDRRVVEKR